VKFSGDESVDVDFRDVRDAEDALRCKERTETTDDGRIPGVSFALNAHLNSGLATSTGVNL
jgi:hypothetical protein